MTVSVRVKLNPNAAKKSLTPAIKADLMKRAQRVANGAKRRCPVDTGKLRSSIKATVESGPGGLPMARVGTNVDYAMFVHEGTRTPITPKSGKFLVFKVKASRTLVFARQVRGQRGVPFLKEALQDARTSR